MNRAAKILALSLSFVVFSYSALGYVLDKTAQDKTYRSLGVFTEVLQHVQQDYVEEPQLGLVTSGALHGLLESLDARSSYLSPREYAEYKKNLHRNARGEIGAALSKRFGYIIVVAVLPDSPAQKAGLRSGDILEAIAGFTTREMSIGQAELLLAGEPGTSVKVAVVARRFGSGGQTQDVEVTRAPAVPPRVVAEILPVDAETGEFAVAGRPSTRVAYVRVASLEAGKAEEIRQQLAQLERQGARKLILDLRECAFGEAHEAVAAARLFRTSGAVATLRGQTVPSQEFAADPARVAWKHPVTVLISRSTSGAAEILAAALGAAEAARPRADLVGERTIGSASEQRLIPLEDGAALVLTVANYYTPEGKSIPADGVAPSVDVASLPESSEEVVDAGEPDSGQAPLQEAAHDASRAPAASHASARELTEDRFVKKALEILLPPPATAPKPVTGAAKPTA